MIEPFIPENSFKGAHTFGSSNLSLHFDEQVLVIKYTGEITPMHLKFSIASGLCTSSYCGLILDIREADLNISNKAIIQFFTFVEHLLSSITKLNNGNFKFLLKLKHQDFFEEGNCFYWIPKLKEYFCHNENEAIDSISDYWESLGDTLVERLLKHQPVIEDEN